MICWLLVLVLYLTALEAHWHVGLALELVASAALTSHKFFFFIQKVHFLIHYLSISAIEIMVLIGHSAGKII